MDLSKAEERGCKLEHRSIEVSQYEEKKVKRMRKMKKT